ncbi:DUF4810 domain-containing protein [Uruburuella testudinis]|uniref:DUF4810 domain-containing protein n=1 Tax=Uruburuella testudinis TaxID=1282863 RepID=A0ABY4DXY1_9NEIS|nr:DUF4810 domain-containing protein [Uruburuella testudinis]UOO82467.1 DUF4810 domain-containing protein [Uruburuella testudinis]
MKAVFLVPLVCLTAACGTAAPSLYYWDQYPSAVYQGMQGKQAADAQIATLEQYLNKAAAKNKTVAPGVYAQLGMLYVETGRAGLAEKAFIEEKTRFPESTRFMDFLLKKPVAAAQGS